MIHLFSHDPTLADELLRALPGEESRVFSDESALAAALSSGNPDTIIFDLRYEPKPSRLLERVHFENPAIMVIAIISPPGTDEITADKIFAWPVQPSEIALALIEKREERRMIESCGLVGRSSELAAAARIVIQVAPSDINVLITGPSGAGKEMIARALHAKSKKPSSPFVAVNVAALAPGIIESELFGHERGSFTGATARRIGLFEQASGGMIFLDEIAEIPLEIQAKLLRILENRVFTRVGGNTPIKANFRLIAATNKDLTVERGRFREDLYYRLRVVSIELPALSRRKADIAPLALHFLELRSRELKASKLHIEPGAMRLFHKYDWPGNVRELKNVIDSFAITSSTGRIRAVDFEKYMIDNTSRATLLPVVTHRTPEAAEHQLIFQALMTLSNEIVSLRRLIERELEMTRGGEPVRAATVQHGSVNVEEVERGLVERALDVAGGNRKKAARLLGIGERTLYRKLEKYGLSDTDGLSSVFNGGANYLSDGFFRPVARTHPNRIRLGIIL
jgi:DNA-binding NtrC family response regulator